MQPVLEQDTIIEMKDMSGGGTVGQGELVPVKRSSCCGRIFKDWTQVPSSVCVATNGALTIAAIVIVIAASLFMTDPSDAGLQKGIVIGGSVVAFILLLNGAAQCVSCMRVRQFKPEKDLEDQIGTFRDRVGDLEGQNKDLAETAKKLDAERQQWEDTYHKQEQATDRIQRTLDQRVQQFDAIRKQLETTTTELEQVSKAFDLFKKKTAETYQFIMKLGQVNLSLGMQLKELGIQAEEFKELDEAWDGNIAGLSGETDEFSVQNKRLEALNSELKRQVALMGTFHGMISEVASKFKESAARLDEYDDKLLEATKKLESAVREKSVQLAELEKKLAEQNEILGTLKKVLLGQKNGAEKFKEVIEMIEKILEEKTG
ncbi:hypothetical protein [Estrella lausannensis]|uniref:Putative inc protein n=1 Tax=Estrella lausannensis TaxID=483423 RepID=A0A0H5DQM5_9BACT|nr:hypothetical protein [Estrella lausannensis]CRX37879.1 Putative inc protein [Estrella lausannensis]